MDTTQVTVGSRPVKRQRTLRSNAEKRRIVEEALAGTASVAEVAHRNGVNANLLFNWRRLYQQGLLEQSREPASASLVPVHVSPATIEPPAPRVEPGGRIEIELPGDIRMRVEGAVDAATVVEVLAALRAR